MREVGRGIGGFQGKGGSIRTFDIPIWVKQGIDALISGAKIEEVRLVRQVSRRPVLRHRADGRYAWCLVTASANKVWIEWLRRLSVPPVSQRLGGTQIRISVCLSVFLIFGSKMLAQTSDFEILPIPAAPFHLAPGAEEDFTLTISSGQVLSVAFLQMQGSLLVTWKPEGPQEPASETLSNRSGKLSSITFHSAGLVKQVQSPPDQVKGSALAPIRGEFVVQNQGKRPAEFRVLAERLRAPTASDRTMLDAEQEEAQGAAPSMDHTLAAAQVRLRHLQMAEQGWRATDQTADLVRTLALESFNEAFLQNNGTAALQRQPELIKLAEAIATISPAEAGSALKTAAFVFAKQARYDDALQQYNRALKLFEGTDDIFNRVVVLENRAKVERIEGHVAQAAADLEQAIPLAVAEADTESELALQIERGAIATASGQLGTAYEADLRAVDLSATVPNAYLAGLAWSDLGVAYTELQDFSEANAALNRADEIWKKAANAYGKIQTMEDRAELRLAEGDTKGALEAFRAGIAPTASLPREQSYFLRGLAITEMRSGQVSLAAHHLEQARQEAEDAHVDDTLSSIYTSLGDVHAQQNQWKQASVSWRRAEAIAKEQNNKVSEVIALSGIIRSEVKSADFALAGETCLQATSILESIREHIPDVDLRLSFFSSRHALYDLCVRTSMQSRDQEAAFNVAEHGRARALLDQAASAGLELDLPSPLSRRIAENDRLLAEAKRSSKRTHGGSQQKVFSLLDTRESLLAEAEGAGMSAELARARVPASEREVMSSLDASTALVCYWLGRDQSWVWLVTAKRATVYALPPAEQLERQIRRYLANLLAPLSAGHGTSVTEEARLVRETATSAHQQGLSLGQMLLPMRLPDSIHRLLLVKDGALLSLSFASLPCSRGGYLGQHFAFATEPSASFAQHNRPARRPFSQMRSVVFAQASSPAEAGVNGGDGSVWVVAEAAALPFARREEAVVNETFGSQHTTIFEGPAASRSNARSLDWSRFDVAHFATHSVVQPVHPELSGLVLAPEGSSSHASSAGGKQSLLTFFDVLRLKAPLQLVVLSSCSSGTGKFVPGEGKLALDNAFLAAGASRVIASLWPVDDEATSIFMSNFYRFLERTHSPMQSLQDAERVMAQSKEWSAPYYWGAFTLSGQWTSFSEEADGAGSRQRSMAAYRGEAGLSSGRARP